MEKKAQPFEYIYFILFHVFGYDDINDDDRDDEEDDGVSVKNRTELFFCIIAITSELSFKFANLIIYI